MATMLLHHFNGIEQFFSSSRDCCCCCPLVSSLLNSYHIWLAKCETLTLFRSHQYFEVLFVGWCNSYCLLVFEWAYHSYACGQVWMPLDSTSSQRHGIAWHSIHLHFDTQQPIITKTYCMIIIFVARRRLWSANDQIAHPFLSPSIISLLSFLPYYCRTAEENLLNASISILFHFLMRSSLVAATAAAAPAYTAAYSMSSVYNLFIDRHTRTFNISIYKHV